MKKLIDKLSIKVFQYVYSRQKKAHQKRMNKLKKSLKKGALFANTCGQKTHSTFGATLTIGAESKEQKKANQEKIEKLIKDNLYDTKKLFDYIKGACTPVYKIKYAKRILSCIKEQEGFILPKKGLSALYLNLILNKKTGLKTPEMFVVSSFDVNLYAFIYQFYNWYCYKMKLEGYEAQTQEKFKHIFELTQTQKINSLNFEEILNLKGAIKRDIEAINFVQNFVKNYEQAKKVMQEAKI